MGNDENRKRMFRNAIMLYIRMLFSMFISFVISRQVLICLGVEDYGIYNVVGGIVVLFTFMNTAMSSSTQRYLTFEIGRGNISGLQCVFSTSLLIHALISLFILLLSETVGLWFLFNKLSIPDNRMEAAVWVFHMSVLGSLVTIMSVPYNAVVIAYEKMNVFAYISIVDVLLRLLVVCLLPYLPVEKLIIYSVALLGVSLFIRLIYVVYCKRNMPEVRFSFLIDKKKFSEMLSFAGWNLLGNMAFVAYTQGTNMLLNVFFGPAVNAARAVAVQLQGSVNNFCSSFQTALNPQITKSFALGNQSYMHRLILSSSKYSFFLLLLLSLPILVETKQILFLWLKIVPDYAVQFVRISLLIVMVDVLANPLIVSAQATGRIRNYQIVVGGILLLIVPFSYLGLKLWARPEVVFIIHFCVVTLAQYVRLWMLHFLIGISLKEYVRFVCIPLIRVLVCSMIFPLIVFYWLEESYLRLLLVVVTSWLSILVVVYLLGINAEEKVYLKNLFFYLKRRLYDSCYK